jgi:hypothetical protein
MVSAISSGLVSRGRRVGSSNAAEAVVETLELANEEGNTQVKGRFLG